MSTILSHSSIHLSQSSTYISPLQSNEVTRHGTSCTRLFLSMAAHLILTCIPQSLTRKVLPIEEDLSSQPDIVKRPSEKWVHVKSTESMYGEHDLSSCSLFTGGLINFGYYKDPVFSKPMSTDERTDSEKELYRRVTSQLNITSSDDVLEVASGLGVGTALVLNEFSPQSIHGIDISPEQVERANKIQGKVIVDNPDRLSFGVGDAGAIPQEDQSFNKILSVEAIQHFPSIDRFADESFRVLKPGGRIAITSFFATSEDSIEPAKELIETARDGIDRFIPIETMKATLERAGYRNVKIESIGDHVWPGYDQWISQTEFKGTWDENWYKGFKEGLFDYFIITADKPEAR